MNKNTTTQNRKNGKRDPLAGAPGHNANAAPTAEPVAAKKTSSSASAEPGSPMVESLIQSLGSVFGEESVEKWRDLLKANRADAQASFYRILRDQFPELPEDFSLADLAKVAAWKPVKTVEKHPAASAATVAASVGAFFLLREYMSGAVNGESIRNVGKRAKTIVASAASMVPTKVISAKKKSAGTSTTKGRKGKAGAKATKKVSTKKAKAKR